MRSGVFLKIEYAQLDKKTGEYFRIFTKSGMPIKNEALRYLLNTLPVGIQGYLYGVSYSECLKRFGKVGESWHIVVPNSFEDQIKTWRLYVHETSHHYVILKSETIKKKYG